MIRWLLIAALFAAPATGFAQAKVRSFAARLQVVEDDIAIRRLLVDYAAFLDSRDYDRYAALFAPDGTWSSTGGSYEGRGAIRRMLENMLGPAGQPNHANYHIITNPRIDITGDRATATSRYLFVMRARDGSPTPSLAGIYRDDLVRQNGRWAIRRRVADDVMPTAEEWRKIMATRASAP